jgi:hypothetical protein
VVLVGGSHGFLFILVGGSQRDGESEWVGMVTIEDLEHFFSSFATVGDVSIAG